MEMKVPLHPEVEGLYRVTYRGVVVGAYSSFSDAWLHAYSLPIFSYIDHPNGDHWVINPNNVN